MKNRILFIVVIASFCFVCNGFSQGPGFMGKHFYAKYDVGFSADNATQGGRFRNNFSFNYIFNKRFSVGISHNVYDVGVLNEFPSDSEFTIFPVRELGFNLRAYLSSQFIAPVGTYFIVEISRVNVDLSELVELEIKGVGTAFGFGISRVLYNKLIIDVSTTLGSVGNTDFIPSEIDDEFPGLDNIGNELSDFNILNWRVGVGYLLF